MFILGKNEGFVVGYLSPTGPSSDTITTSSLLIGGSCAMDEDPYISDIPKLQYEWTTRGVLLTVDTTVLSQPQQDDPYTAVTVPYGAVMECTFKSNVYELTGPPAQPTLGDLVTYFVPRATNLLNDSELEELQFTALTAPIERYFAFPTTYSSSLSFTMEWQRKAQDLLVDVNSSPFGNQYQFHAMVNLDRTVGTTLEYNPTMDGTRNTIVFHYYSAPGDYVSGVRPPLTSAIYYIGPLAADMGYSSTYIDYRIEDAEWLDFMQTPRGYTHHLQLFFSFSPTYDMSTADGPNIKQYRASYVLD